MSRPCDTCSGQGWIIAYATDGREGIACPACLGRSTTPETPEEVRQRQRIIRTELLTSALHPAPPPRDTHEVTPS
jgi:DnaJ-class molecular chaperone